MELSTVLSLLGILLLVGAFVSYPLIMSVRQPQTEDQERSVLLADRERLIISLSELDFDHQLGKIPEEDYLPQRTNLIAMGAEVMAKLAAVSGGQNVVSMSPDERKVEALTDEEIEALITKRRTARKEQTDEFCPRCGKAILRSDLFCPSCGHKLS